uniref:Uncharacterized protein n=1 Tax=Ditylenchus dipsaci TaxID=166011 RepID=A0A915CXL7_9BILA
MVYFQSQQENVSQVVAVGTFLTYVGSAVFSFVEIFILSAVTIYNQKKNKKRIFMNNGHSLTESYQLSENIRTGKQLAPTFSLHFSTTIALALVCFFIFYVLKFLIWNHIGWLVSEETGLGEKTYSAVFA